MALVPKKPVALSIGSINVLSVEDKNKNSTYKIHHNTNEEVSFCEKIESRLQLIILIENIVRVQKAAYVSKRPVILCRLRLTILIKKGVRINK